VELVPRRYRSRPVKPPPGDVAFLAVVRTDRGPSLAWVAYDIWHEEAALRPEWAADAAWDPYRERGVLAFAKTHGRMLRIDLHVLDLRARRTVPARLDGTDHRTWPNADAPIASFAVDRRHSRAGRVSRIQVVPERDRVLLLIERMRDDVKPLYMSFAWDTKTWSWLKIVAEPVPPGE